MMTTKTEETVRAVISAVAKHDVSQLGVEEDLVCALGLDSLAGLRVLAGVEKRLGVRFRDQRLAELRTIGRIVAAVREISEEDKP